MLLLGIQIFNITSLSKCTFLRITFSYPSNWIIDFERVGMKLVPSPCFFELVFGHATLSDPLWVGIFDQCVGLISIQHHAGFDQLLICNANSSLESQQRLDDSTYWSNVIPKLGEWSFIAVYGKVNMRPSVGMHVVTFNKLLRPWAFLTQIM